MAEPAAGTNGEGRSVFVFPDAEAHVRLGEIAVAFQNAAL